MLATIELLPVHIINQNNTICKRIFATELIFSSNRDISKRMIIDFQDDSSKAVHNM